MSAIAEGGANLHWFLERNLSASQEFTHRSVKRRVSPMAQRVKSQPTMQEKTRFQSLGQEDPLEEEMATHSSIHAWKIPWIEEPGRQQSMGS